MVRSVTFSLCVNVNTLGLFIALGVPSGSSVNWFLGPEASGEGREVDQGGYVTSALFSFSHLPPPFQTGAAGGWVRGEAGTMTGGWEGGGGPG